MYEQLFSQMKFLTTLVNQSATNLGTFIQSLMRILRSAADARVLLRERTRPIVSIRCCTYCVGNPHVAGRDGAHLGWHTMLHSTSQHKYKAYFFTEHSCIPVSLTSDNTYGVIMGYILPWHLAAGLTKDTVPRQTAHLTARLLMPVIKRWGMLCCRRWETGRGGASDVSTPGRGVPDCEGMWPWPADMSPASEELALPDDLWAATQHSQLHNHLSFVCNYCYVSHSIGREVSKLNNSTCHSSKSLVIHQ